MELDTTKLKIASSKKTTSHDNCTVLDIGSGTFPRYIEIRPPGGDGSRMVANWDGNLDLSVNDKVRAIETGDASIWRIASMGGDDSGAGLVRVSKVWESDFGAASLEADADGNLAIKNSGTTTHTIEGNVTTSRVIIAKENAANRRALTLQADSDSANRDAPLEFIRARAGAAAVQSGDRIGDLFFSGHDGTDYNRSTRLGAVIDGTVSANTVPTALVFDTSTTNSGGTTERMRITSAGNVGIGDAAPDSQLVVANDIFIGPADASGDTADGDVTIGLSINQEANDDAIINLFSSDVAHGMTSLAETDNYASFRKASGASGGLRINCYTEASIGFQVNTRVASGVTTKTTSSTGALNIQSQKKSGTSAGAMGTDENLLTIRNHTTTRWIVDEAGNIFYGGSDDGTITDSYDDPVLLSGFRAIVSPQGSPAHKRFRGFVKETENILVQQGVLTAPLTEGGLVSDTALKGLLIDAIIQLNQKINRLEGEI